MRPPNTRILSTGTEITHGLYPDTNAMELSQILRAHGFRVLSHAAVPDSADEIRRALHATFGATDLLLVTGGLGPTEDDLNRELIAEVWNLPLRHLHRAEVSMRQRFARLGRDMPERNRKQAFLPQGSQPLLNHWGTAPGFLLPPDPARGRPALVALPGVPHEWRAMLERYLPRVILPLFPDRPKTALATLHLTQIAESAVNERIRSLFNADPQLDYTILASRGTIRVRILATGHSEEERDARLAQALARTRDLLPADHLFHEGPDTALLEEVVVTAFTQARKTLSLAESCTGGGVAKRLTDIPGSSAVLREACVTYSNDAKARLLGVPASVLEHHGAVSEPCARAMAQGALRASAAHVAVAITGIAGPSGGTPEKPVGLVWVALSDRQRTIALSRQLGGDRAHIRLQSETIALDLLRRWIHNLPLEPSVPR